MPPHQIERHISNTLGTVDRDRGGVVSHSARQPYDNTSVAQSGAARTIVVDVGLPRTRAPDAYSHRLYSVCPTCSVGMVMHCVHALGHM